MSNFYAIKDTTLTTLGDAVRSKSNETRIDPLIYNVNEVAKRNCESYDNFTNEFIVSSTTINMPNKYNSVYCNFKAIEGAKAVRIKGHIKLIGGGSPGESVNFNFLPFEWKFGQGAPDYTNAIIYNLSMITYQDRESKDIDIILDNTNIATLTISTDYQNTFTVGYYLEAIGLDENYNSLNNGEITIHTQQIVKNTMTLLEMADTINEMVVAPEEILTITGDCRYAFAYGVWDKYLTTFKDKYIIKDVSNATYMFFNSPLTEIPDINISETCYDISKALNACKKIVIAPYIIGPERNPSTITSNTQTIEMSNLFYTNTLMEEIPYDFFWKLVPNKEYWEAHRAITTKGQNNLFYSNPKLRELPDISMLGGAWTSTSSPIYYNMCYMCYILNKVLDIPVCGTFKRNGFQGTFNDCQRLNRITFLTNEDGTPKIANWKTQTIDLTKNIGYGTTSGIIVSGGLSADKQVKDDATYQALKNDPDWFSIDINYSRYNHNSAVETINSLPDTSAYLTANGGTNTIKFSGTAGALTDGGAINTLTEEEIAVATAKGWTVSLV